MPTSRTPAACHLHSEWSYDGKWTIPALAQELAGRGYRIAMMTEHDRGFTPERLAQFRADCAAASNESIFVLPGIEYSNAANTIHVLVWGPVPFLGENLDTTHLLEQVRSHGGVAVFAHPSRRQAWKLFDARWQSMLIGVEIWNRKTDGWAPSPHARRLLTDGVAPFVGLDFHTAKQLFPLTMQLELQGVASETTVVDALRARRCTPQAFGKPVSSSTQGFIGVSLRMAERCRKTLARAYRFAKK